MALFKKKRTIKRCKTLARYVRGIDGTMVEHMSRFLLENRNNTIQVTREYLMFVTAAGVVASSIAITPLRDDFNAIVVSSSWARVQAPYHATGDVSSSTTADTGSGGSSWVGGGSDDTAREDGGTWSEFSDSDGDSFTNNNNNNKNNNNG